MRLAASPSQQSILVVSANYDIPMAGVVEVQWNLGQEENGEIRGHINIVSEGKSLAPSIIQFNEAITAFNDDHMEQAALLALALLWRDDLKPILFDQLWAAFIEMRERNGGLVEDEPEQG